MGTSSCSTAASRCRGSRIGNRARADDQAGQAFRSRPRRRAHEGCVGRPDYINAVFDDWVADAASAFQAVEVDGQVVGVQRLRPYAPGLVWYEGLRVATSHRRQGLARAMLTSAIAEAREQGHGEMRLATGNPDAVRLFESVGFQRLVDLRWWRGPRVEGGESARIPAAAEAEKLWPVIAKSPGI